MQLSFFASNRTHLATLALLALSAAACGARAAAGPAARAREDIPVTTAVVNETTVARTLALTGTLLPNRKSEVAADAVGKVTATFVERGSFVAKGAVLARLDGRGAALGHEEAAAQAAVMAAQNALARTECGRAETLFASGAINRADYDRSRTQCEAATFSARAAAARARLAGKTLADAVVRAPFAGQIAERMVNEGEFVRPDSRVVTLVEIETLRLELSVPESAVAQITANQEVRFSVAAFPGETFAAQVRYVGATLRRFSRDLIVEAVVANKDRRLRPGMFATAHLTLGETTQLVVPLAAVQSPGSGESPRLFVVNDGVAEERVVLLGERRGEVVAITSGLQAGEVVIVSSKQRIRDGLRVAAASSL